jgi:hypothetical protein
MIESAVNTTTSTPTKITSIHQHHLQSPFGQGFNQHNHDLNHQQPIVVADNADMLLTQLEQVFNVPPQTTDSAGRSSQYL